MTMALTSPPTGRSTRHCLPSGDTPYDGCVGSAASLLASTSRRAPTVSSAPCRVSVAANAVSPNAVSGDGTTPLARETSTARSELRILPS